MVVRQITLSVDKETLFTNHDKPEILNIKVSAILTPNHNSSMRHPNSTIYSAVRPVVATDIESRFDSILAVLKFDLLQEIEKGVET